MMTRLQRHGLFIFLLELAAGCGQSESETLRQQEGSLRTHFELQKQATPKLTAKERRIHQERIRMQFGDQATE